MADCCVCCVSVLWNKEEREGKKSGGLVTLFFFLTRLHSPADVLEAGDPAARWSERRGERQEGAREEEGR